MIEYPEYITQGSAQRIPYTDFKTASAIMWGTSSSDPMSEVELRRVPVGYIIMPATNANIRPRFIRETEKKTGQGEILLDRIIDKKIICDITQSDAILTMIASEEVLGRDWDTPEEDEAWAHL